MIIAAQVVSMWLVQDTLIVSLVARDYFLINLEVASKISFCQSWSARGCKGDRRGSARPGPEIRDFYDFNAASRSFLLFISSFEYSTFSTRNKSAD